MKIAILDDDAFFLKLLDSQIRACGHRLGCAVDVWTFDRADAALAALNESRGVDLLVCDLQLPGMDGVEVLRQLRHLRFEGRLALVSGEDPRTLQSAAQLARAHGLDVVGALTKPVERDRLDAVMTAAAAPRVPRTPRAAPLPGLDAQQALDRSQLCNHYQPQVDFATGEVVGMEALVRWDHPVHGLLVPAQFLSAFAEPALDAALTHTVLAAALSDLVAWTTAGHAWTLSVNISLTTLLDLELPDRVASAAAAAGAPLDRLCLELTEGRVLEAPAVQLDVLTRLRLRRVCLSIDDFGTGYSSLARLRDLPFGELKIDRSFAHGVATDERLQSFLHAGLALANDLGMRSVVEGVEDRADFDYLRASGCSAAQGFLIARPMHARLLNSWHSAWVRRVPDLFN